MKTEHVSYSSGKLGFSSKDAVFHGIYRRGHCQNLDNRRGLKDLGDGGQVVKFLIFQEGFSLPPQKAMSEADKNAVLHKTPHHKRIQNKGSGLPIGCLGLVCSPLLLGVAPNGCV